MKVLKTFWNASKLIIVSIIVVGLVGCGPKTIEPMKMKPLTFSQTPEISTEVFEKIKKMRTKIGPVEPIIVTHKGVKYVAFTKTQLQQITAERELSAYLETFTKLQHEQSVLLTMEVDQLKRLAKLQRLESETYQSMFVNARNDANRERYQRNVEGYGYKAIMIGQLLIILLLVL